MAQTHNDTHTPAMQRDPDRLARDQHDLLIIGGGIYGVWAALDAAQRGLRVALLEQDDFGSGTSANSQRVVHGGLRYLQHGDLKRMRESIRERSTLLRVAGHLVQPMPFVVPTYGLGLRGRPAMFTAMKLNDFISADRNRGLPTSRKLPNARLVPPDKCLKLVPGIESNGLTGGALLYDAQVTNSERLTLAIVRSAVAAGAQVANHMRVTGLMTEGRRITGVEVEDKLTGKTLCIGARVTLSCAGPWTAKTLASMSGDPPPQPHRFPVLRAVALVTHGLFGGMGLAVPSHEAYRDDKELIGKGYRNLFVTPWRGGSLVGTFYSEYHGDPDNLSVSEWEVRSYVDEFNRACPGVPLSYDDVKFTFAGLMPKAKAIDAQSEPVCEKRCRLIDHGESDEIDGLVTIFGVKWTTARGVAEQAVTIAARQLGKETRGCRTADAPLYGAPAGDPVAELQTALDSRPSWASEPLITHLFESYGQSFGRVLDLAEMEPELREPVSGNAPTILAQVAHGVRYEMALTLEDVLFRRTPLGFGGWPGQRAIRRCAELMAKELAWPEHEILQNSDAVSVAYRRRGLAVDDTAPAGP